MAQATQAQQDYILSLIGQNKRRWFGDINTWNGMVQSNPWMADDAAYRRERDAAAAATLMVAAYDTIVIPAALTQEKASRWITALKSADDAMIVTALQNANAAAAIGAAEFIAANGDALRKILRVK